MFSSYYTAHIIHGLYRYKFGMEMCKQLTMHKLVIIIVECTCTELLTRQLTAMKLKMKGL